MFATLAGGYPATDPGSRPGRSVDALVREILAEQAEAGLGLLTDGSLRWPDPVDALGRALLGASRDAPRRDGPLTVDAWTFAAGAAEWRPGQAVPARAVQPGPTVRRARGRPEADLTLAFADALAVELVDLAAAGCPFIQVDEDAAVSIGRDPAERALFREAQTRLLAGLGDDSTGDRPHLSLAISGGNADAAGPDTIFSASYDSYLFDLIAGPENWRLVTVAPAERGSCSAWPTPARRPSTSERSSSGPSATRRPVAVAARRGSGSPRRAAWRVCRGRRPGPRSIAWARS